MSVLKVCASKRWREHNRSAFFSFSSFKSSFLSRARAHSRRKKILKRIARKDYWRRLLSPFATAERRKKKNVRNRAETFHETPTRDDENSPTRSAFRALKVVSSIFESIARIARLQKRAHREGKKCTRAEGREFAPLSLSTARSQVFDFSFHFEKKKKRKKRG